MPSPPHIAFICSGNICRSPMAEAIARREIENRGVAARVSSAGTLGLEEYPASGYSARAMAEIGIDLSTHRSRGVTAAYLEDVDAIVVMSPEHEEYLLHQAPALAGRIHRLWQFTTVPERLGEITDPVGCSFDAFVRCREDLLECIENWLVEFLDRDRSTEPKPEG